MTEQFQTSLGIIEPFQPSVKTFESFQEFSKYYNLHKSDIDSMNTYRLNKSFIIPGYKFTRITTKDGNKELKIKKKYIGVNDVNNKNEYSNVITRLETLERDYIKLVNFVNTQLMR